jgi:hypothetical protein
VLVTAPKFGASKLVTWAAPRQGNPIVYWLLVASTGFLWSGEQFSVGRAASLGSLGNIIAWPIFMTLDIIVALF